MKLKMRLDQGDEIIHYQQALEKTNRELEEARRQIQLTKDTIASAKEVVPQVEPSKKKRKRKKKD